ncbi:MAG: HPr family phosphocarrier protein [Turicibacter sp.]|nr:HPr family phosphocarrier protein [Turicibacter sp.]
MIEKIVIVGTSVETRRMALMVQAASKFMCKIDIETDGRIANAKSIMGVVSLGLVSGQEIVIVADGEDEKQAVSVVEQFLL